MNSNFMKSPTSYNNIYDDLNKINNDMNPNTIKTQRLHQINDGIFELERNIADLNRNYKNLMIKLNVS